MPDIRLTTLKCRIKPKDPEDCGYLSWNTVKAELAKQAQRPLAERLRPCIPQKVWLYCSTCLKCRNALWGLLIDGGSGSGGGSPHKGFHGGTVFARPK